MFCLLIFSVESAVCQNSVSGTISDAGYNIGIKGVKVEIVIVNNSTDKQDTGRHILTLREFTIFI